MLLHNDIPMYGNIQVSQTKSPFCKIKGSYVTKIRGFLQVVTANVNIWQF